MDKRKSKRIVIALCVLTLLAIAVGVGAVLISYSIKPSEVTETDELYDSDSNTDISILDTSEVIGTDAFVYEETLPAPVPLPELDDGNEVYLDMGVLAKLQVIEDSGGEDKVNEIFDTMFLLINEFADREYSALAIYQIQRFYFICFDSLRGEELDVLCERIGDCISAEGADKSVFECKIKEQFGFGEGIDPSFVFEAEVSS